ncbi:Protein of unknown function [Anaerosphaera aminiphila DSM 21120]|uniref:DUF2922 domain-containing protein n=1 Tax=Anaerosphaera aminiphila DSM 21120 TaxID=1120995 RepID=A0A1M5TTV4_9FIRM|nr:DUF2922 family protein [Anaerosphaera aminiphila]SHH53833.1 Protein of unknown function [Anaerosphaera aminiphila DSM 21120]
MENAKSLELELSDVNEKVLKLSMFDPKDDIAREDIVNFEQAIVSSNVFLGPTGNIKEVSKAYIKEINIKEIL